MSFVEDAMRVLKLTRKPRKDEFIMIAKVTGLGMIIIGVIGTLITVVFDFLGIGV
ncbi:MAG: protein translocase SEC61 complex subunit gamma [Candidatus Diapherotrites archaeon]|nr:protein translocase SEC61 complex subunit gamma [Candidatus Diapherotrites archaeon]